MLDVHQLTVNSSTVRTVKLYLCLGLFAQGSIYDNGYFLHLFFANAPFLFVLVFCLFGVTFGAIRAKSRGQVRQYGFYSAVYTYMLLSLLAAGAHYRLQWDTLWLAGMSLVIGALAEGVVNKFLTQFDNAPDFSAVLKLVWDIVTAVRSIIGAYNNKDNNATPGRTTR